MPKTFRTLKQLCQSNPIAGQEASEKAWKILKSLPETNLSAGEIELIFGRQAARGEGVVRVRKGVFKLFGRGPERE